MACPNLLRIGAALLLLTLSACATAGSQDMASLDPDDPPPGRSTSSRPSPGVERPPPDGSEGPPPVAIGGGYAGPVGSAGPGPQRTNTRHRWLLCPESALRQGSASYLMLVIYPSRPPADRKCAGPYKAKGVLSAHSVRGAVREAANSADVVTPPTLAAYEGGAKVFRWRIEPARPGALNLSVALDVLYATPGGRLEPRHQMLPILSDVEVAAQDAPPKPPTSNASVIPAPKLDPDAPWWQNVWSLALYAAAGVGALATFLRNTEGVVGTLRKWRLLPGGQDAGGGPPA